MAGWRWVGRFARTRANTHLRRGEAAPKMGHPELWGLVNGNGQARRVVSSRQLKAKVGRKTAAELTMMSTSVKFALLMLK